MQRRGGGGRGPVGALSLPLTNRFRGCREKANSVTLFPETAANEREEEGEARPASLRFQPVWSEVGGGLRGSGQ